ncbi:MAG TPA: glycosyltransferase [Anaeromyxobacter sp.]|nr:glycosyltransferase [Anaeromyxobacter sp.]
MTAALREEARARARTAASRGGGWEPAPGPGSQARDLAFQSLATLALVLGAWYLAWRWTSSLNPDALGFSVAVAAAETLAYVGSVLFFLSIWRVADPAPAAPPRTVNDIVAEPLPEDRPIEVDVFVTTYDEPVELVRLSVRDAKRVRYPHPLAVTIHVLDDGRRPAMAAMAAEEGVRYLTRRTNAGFKAGNLRNGLERSRGDLVVVCDADTRLLPGFLADTLGYFRDPSVAWVQTPQRFADVDPGMRLPEWLASRARLGRAGRAIGRAAERVLGPVAVGADPLGTDPRAFYDVVQRSRNWCNAAFCCGAGSIHRREAIMDAAVRRFAHEVRSRVEPFASKVKDPALRAELSRALSSQAARHLELMPYAFHVSEDIYTSVLLHGDGTRRWRSVYHPRALTRMLSPQDTLAWSIQRFKYASGTLDIALRRNPLRLPGLSAWQRVMYGATMYAYLAPLWTIPLMLAPLAFFFGGVTPIRAYGPAFWAHLFPFVVASRLALWAGTWGVPMWRSEQYHLAGFWLNLRALVHVLAGRPLRFNVTPKLRASRRALGVAVPHAVLLAAMAAGVLVGALRLGRAPAGEVNAFVANVFWTFHNGSCLLPLVLAAWIPRRRAGGSGA